MSEPETGVENAMAEALPFRVLATKPHFAQSTVFHYVKSQNFRTLHVDGAIGGITPRKYIHCALFSEHATILRVVEVEIKDGNATGEQSIMDGRAGYIQELEVDVMLDLDAAKALRNWLSKRIEELEEAAP